MTTTEMNTPEAVEAVPAAPATEPKQSRFAAALATVQGAPKWVLMAVPAAVIALGGYGYVQHGDKLFGANSDAVAQAPVAPMGPMVAGPFGQPQPYAMPVAYDPAYGPAYGHYGRGDAYGNGYGRGHGHGHGNGRARGNFSFSMGGDFDGNGSGWGNGYGDGRGYNRANNGYYY